MNITKKHAIAWDSDRRNSAWNDKVWHDRFIKALVPGDRVLDLGCGGGFPVARHMHASGLQVTGVDSSPTMISLCRERFPGHGWILGDMRKRTERRSATIAAILSFTRAWLRASIRPFSAGQASK